MLANQRLFSIVSYVLNVKAVVAAFNQEKALVGAFSVIVQPVVEPMDRFTALSRRSTWAPWPHSGCWAWLSRQTQQQTSG